MFFSKKISCHPKIVVYRSILLNEGMKRLLIFATFDEAQETLLKLNALEGEKGVWHAEEDLIVISGWGCKNANLATLKHGPKASEIWNVGIAGTLSEKLPLGSFHKISFVGKSTSPSLSLSQEGARLFSSDHPVHDVSLRNQLAKEWDLVDMEGYGVATAAKILNKSCYLWKLVSDFALPGGSEIIKKNMSNHSNKLARIV